MKTLPRRFYECIELCFSHRCGRGLGTCSPVVQTATVITSIEWLWIFLPGLRSPDAQIHMHTHTRTTARTPPSTHAAERSPHTHATHTHRTYTPRAPHTHTPHATHDTQATQRSTHNAHTHTPHNTHTTAHTHHTTCTTHTHRTHTLA